MDMGSVCEMCPFPRHKGTGLAQAGAVRGLRGKLMGEAKAPVRPQLPLATGSQDPCPQDRSFLTASSLILCTPRKTELQVPVEGPVQALYTPNLDLHYKPTGRHYSLPAVHPYTKRETEAL